MDQKYGSYTPPGEVFEGTVCEIITPQCVNEPIFNSLISPVSSDGVEPILSDTSNFNLSSLQPSDPNSIDDVNAQNESFLENSEKIETVLMEWKTDLYIKVVAVKAYEEAFLKLKRKQKCPMQ